MPARATRSWAKPAERSMRVQQGFLSLALAADGTIYTTGRGEGRASGFFRDGVLMGQLDLSQHHSRLGQAIAVDDKFVYVSVYQAGSGDKEETNDFGGIHTPRQGTNWGAVGRFTHGGSPAPFANGVGWFGQYKVINDQGSTVSGLVTDGKGRLYVSDTPSDRVIALNTETMETISEGGREMVAPSLRPGRISRGHDGDIWVIGHPSFKTEKQNLKVNCVGQTTAGFQNDSQWRWRGSAVESENAVDVQGVENAGAGEIYQTAIEADQLGYRFRGYLPGSEFTLSLHFADFRASKVGERVFSVSLNRENNIIDPVLQDFDIIAAAGGKNKAIVKTVTGTVGANGQIWIYIRAQNGQRALLNALEIEAIRYSNEIDQPYIVSRFDKDLNPKSEPVTVPQGMIPVAIAFNKAGDLVVADNGPDLCLKVYSVGAGIPDLTKPSQLYGQKGGVLGGAVPGKAGPLRFEYLTDIAFSADGSLAVANDGGSENADIAGGSLRFFDSTGKLDWIAEGYMFMDVPDWPVKKGADPKRVLYSVNRSFDMNLDEPAGSNWAFRGFTVDRFRYPNDFRLFTNSLDRGNVYTCEVEGHRIMAVTRSELPVAIYRFDPATHGEIAIPVAAYGPNPKANHKFPGAPGEGEWLWVDANRDGQYSPDEFKTRPFEYNGGHRGSESPVFHGFTMDERGGLWFSNDRHFIRYFPLQIREGGLPGYTWESSRILAIPKVCHKKEIGRIAYDMENDSLYLSTVLAPGKWTMTVPSREQPSGRVVGNAILRLDGVMQAFTESDSPDKLTPAPDPAWVVEIPFNSTTVRSRHTQVDLPMALSAVGDYVFVAYSAWGRVRAYRADDGEFVGMMEIGRSLKTDRLDGSGMATEDPNDFGLIDSPLSLRVMEQDGVYWIAFHDNFTAHTKVYRWEPGVTIPSAVDGLVARPEWQDSKAAIALSWPASDGADHYRIERAPARAGGSWTTLNDQVKGTSLLDAQNLQPDQLYFYRVCAINGHGQASDYSNIVHARAQGQPTISISFDAPGDNSARKMHAGYIARPGWNYLQRASGKMSEGLKDDRDLVSPVQIHWQSPEVVANEKVDGKGDDHSLMAHALRSTNKGKPIEIKLTDIPFPRYTLYVYSSNPTQQTQATVEANGRKINLRQRDGNHYHGGYFPVMHEGYGNVGVIRGLEGKSLTLEVTPGAEPTFSKHQDEAAVAGIQIIAE